MRVAFIHPDLGIGGAERWLVDSALALKSHKHDVVIYTSHYDTSHCFDETKQMTVISRGDFLPRHFMGRFYAFFAYLRMIYLAFYIVFFSKFSHDAIVCDQISTCIPVLKLSGMKILFYCHFPDMLLTKRDSFLKKMYRKPIDFAEQYTTGMADRVMVNSRFTLSVFRETFTSLNQKHVDVLYPSLNTASFDATQTDTSLLEFFNPEKKYLFSLNRYERKKNMKLAIETLVHLREHYKEKSWCKDVVLIIAGGYDSRNQENIEHFKELLSCSNEFDLSENELIFLKNPSYEAKLTLLEKSSVLLYTPSNEHFGIVPVEAMYMRTPVVAVNSGGPLETVVEGETGHLSEPDAESFASAVSKLLDLSDQELNEVKMKCRSRVQNNFSFEAFAEKWNFYLNDTMSKRQ